MHSKRIFGLAATLITIALMSAGPLAAQETEPDTTAAGDAEAADEAAQADAAAGAEQEGQADDAAEARAQSR